jgi:4-hydroxy-tetrahydrodipicolinate synthase
LQEPVERGHVRLQRQHAAPLLRPVPDRPPVESWTIMPGQCRRMPSISRAKRSASEVGRLVVVAHVAGAPASPPPRTPPASIPPARRWSTGTAGLSALVGTDPVIATVMMQGARGVYVIAPTPFHDDGRVDEASIDRMTDFFGAAGATGITVLGQMGEAPKLDARRGAGDRRAGDPPRRHAGRRRRLRAGLCRHARAGARGDGCGAAGVMIAPPNTLRTDDQIVGYYRQAVGGDRRRRAVRDPGLSADLLGRHDAGGDPPHRQDNPSCVMLKHEDWPGLDKISALRGFERDGSMRHISILCGNGGLFLDFEMERGADGAMTGYCFPDMLVDVVRLSAAGSATPPTTCSTRTCR